MTAPVRTRRTQAERRAATRSALLDATIDALVEYGYANVTSAQIVQRAGVSEKARYAAILDRLWALHHEPIFIAALELWTAARTDLELRESLSRFARDFTATTSELAVDLMPERASRPEFRAQMELAMASMRGLAVHQSVDTPRHVARSWAAVRGQLLELAGD
jgi:AcrR family transcriptional regulator